MRQFFTVVRAGVRYLCSDVIGVLMLTAFPIMLIFILGNALEGLFSNDNSVEAVSAAYVSDMESSLLYEALSESSVSEYIDLTRHGEEEARELLAAGEVAAVIIERGDEIEVLQASEKPRGSQIVLSAVEACRESYAAAALRAQRGEDPTQYMQLQVTVEEAALGLRTPGAMDYYGVTMLIMIMMYSGLNGVGLFVKNMSGELDRRLRTTPARRSAVVMGSLAAATLVSFLQGLIVYLFSRFAFGVYWGESVLPVLFILLLVVVLSQLLCITLLLLTGSEGATSGIAQVLMWTMAFLSGAMMPVDYGKAGGVFQYMPNSLAQTAMFNIVYGGQAQSIIQPVVLLCAITGGLAVVTLLAGRRKFA